MVRKITKLTPEQEALIPVWWEQFRAEALRTDEIDRKEATKAISALYTTAGLKAPGTILFAQSPLQALLMRSILMQLSDQLEGQLWDQLPDQLRGQLWGQLSDQLRGQLSDQLEDQLRDQLWDQLSDQLEGQLEGQLWGQLRDQLWGQLSDQLRGQLSDQLEGQLWDQLWDQLSDQLEGQLEGQLEDQLYQTIWFVGGWDGFWLAFYKAGRDVGVRYEGGTQDRLDAYLAYSRTCGVSFLYDGIAIVSDRPSVMSFDDDNRLHSDTGAALAWRDGYSIHAWHGTRVPSDWIEAKDTVDPADVIKCVNVEQRSAGCAILGWDRMVDHLDRTVLDGNPETDIGALIELTMPDLPEPGRFLQAVCPRNGTIVLGVPRVSDIDNLPIKTAIAAQAWISGEPASSYQHPEIRT